MDDAEKARAKETILSGFHAFLAQDIDEAEFCEYIDMALDRLATSAPSASSDREFIEGGCRCPKDGTVMQVTMRVCFGPDQRVVYFCPKCFGRRTVR